MSLTSLWAVADARNDEVGDVARPALQYAKAEVYRYSQIFRNCPLPEDFTMGGRLAGGNPPCNMRTTISPHRHANHGMNVRSIGASFAAA